MKKKKQVQSYEIDRQKFLRKLEAVSAGLSKKEGVAQGKCFVFVNKSVWTYNGEVACHAPSGMPEEVEGAVQAGPLMSVLREFDDDKLELSFTPGGLYLQGKNRDSELKAHAEVTLPVENVERPAKGDWKQLPEDFGTAVGVVQNCAVKDGPEAKFAFTCVHIHPKWVEACDNLQLTRFRMKTPIDKPIIVKRDSIKHVTNLDMTEFAETDGWLHFRNPAKVHLSVLRHNEEFPDLGEFLKVTGTPTVLPKGIGKDAKFAEIFSAEVEDRNLAVVTIKEGQITVRGLGVTGKARARRFCKYKGKPLAFGIAPKLLQEITKRHTEAQISKDHLRVDGDRWVFVTCLESVDSAQKKAEKAAAETAAKKTSDEEGEE